MRKTLEDLIKKSKRSPSPAPPLNKKLKTNSNPPRKRKHEEISSAGVALGNSLKENGDSIVDPSDLTKHLDAPPSQPHVEEVHVPKSVNIKKESSDYQPNRNGTYIDLDEENNQNNNDENKDQVFLNGHMQLSGEY